MKKIFIILSILLASILFIPKAYAASARIDVYPSQTTVLVGNTINVTVKISSSDYIGGYEFTLKYDSNILQMISGSPYVIDTPDNDKKTSVSYYYTFRSKKSGKSNIYISGGVVKDWAPNEIPSYKGSTTITSLTQAELQATYSKNNNLSSLSIDGVELSPSFDKNVTDYTVELPPETTKVKVNATPEDSRSSIDGKGDIEVTDGSNTLKVQVTAQNGTIKIYTITANVKELDPIELKLDGKDYKVVRKRASLKCPNSLFEENKTTVKGQEVPSCYNETTKYTLIGLKDSEGIIKYFIINDDNYTPYNELNLGDTYLNIIDTSKVIENYNKTSIKIKDIEYTAYKASDTSRFALVYGLNIENGNEGFYIYDNLENTIQRYDEEYYKSVIDKSNNYKKESYILIGISGLLFILLFTLSIYNLVKNKKTKQKLQTIENTAQIQIEEVKKEIKKTKKKEKDFFDEMEEDKKDPE